MKHSVISELGKSETGHVAIIFAILVFPLFLFIGFNFDVSRYVSANKNVQVATDAAALAGARAMQDASLTDDQVKAIAVATFASNYTANIAGVSCKDSVATVDRTNETVKVDVKCAVAKIFGSTKSTTRQLEFERSAQTNISLTTMDVALMLDMSGSMDGARLTALKSGAKSLISTLITDESGARARISLVPYGDAVNAGVYGNRAQGKPDDDDSDGDGDIVCVSRRTATGSEYTDAAPSASNYVGDEVHGCWDPMIVPLSSDADALNSAVEGLQAKGFSTAGHLGMAWSWYSISSNWSSVWPEASAPTENTEPSTVKAVVLMTDGIFNQHYDWPGRFKKTKSARDLKQLCTNMQADGILIYVVGFDLVLPERTDVNADWFDAYSPQVVLPHCAGDPARFLQPADNDELIDVYKSIAELLKIEAVVVTN